MHPACAQVADVWSCGVMLYIMLAAAYPFGRPEDEQLKPSARMHVMLQVPAAASVVLCTPAPCLHGDGFESDKCSTACARRLAALPHQE